MFIAITIVLGLIIHMAITIRLTRPRQMRRFRLPTVLALSLLFALVLFNPLNWVLDLSFISYELYRPLRNASYVAMGIYSFIFTAFVAREVGWGLARIGRVLPEDPERRDVLAHGVNMSMLGLAGVSAGAGYREARRRAGVVRIEVPIANLPAALERFRIVQISDVHVGPTIERAYVQAIADVINTLEADLIALTGDIVDARVSRIRDDVSPLGRLKSKYGTVCCTGNHEYYAGAAEWIDEFRRLGMTVLNNEHTVIEHGGARVLVGGVTDLSSRRFIAGQVSNPEACLDGAPDCAIKILLAHRPKSVYAAAKAGFDLQLSGHTHGGQFFPWNLVVKLVHEFPAGLGRHRDTQIYVSRGTGYFGPPFRMFAPAEITVLELVQG